MKDLSKMMLALQQFCRQHNLEMPAAVDIRFADETAARQFNSAIKLEYRAMGSEATFNLEARKVDTLCGTPLRIGYGDKAGFAVEI
ncbi:hypothetical protein [Bradyrhizobium sp. Ai1a-2]|uniref:hypothetical protein n=1 Tax=Bradyrhizobium sp. Ai1a-2 TaxID=196490 RepID=UPI00042A0437|nr:hypothetical protein [Bradyrhizobium sp. Ai1a-2]